MGGCLSFKRRSNAAEEDVNVEKLILAEFEKRYAALLAENVQNSNIRVSLENNLNPSPLTGTLEGGELHSLEKRLEKLERLIETNLSDDGSQEEDEEAIWLEAMEYRFNALCSGLPKNPNEAVLKNLKKKEIIQLKKAEDRIVEFEIRLAKLQKDSLKNHGNAPAFSIT